MKGITVSQLNNYIKQVFEAEEFLHNIIVMGEISGVKKSGNMTFFTLKDEGASISCSCYVPGIVFKDGEKVIVRGTVSYWNKAGKISFTVNKCEPCGLGNLMLLFEQLKEKLKAEGLFDAAVKKSIPDVVKRIGVVTSKSGAVIHDIVTVASRRNPAVDIVIMDVHVQGVGADVEIANAIDTMNSFGKIGGKVSGGFCGFDVIIVARGGGSAEDLSAFNSERVARAVFASKIPVVSAVGHESDFTLIDFVADLRAATPSAAAELCVREVVTERDKVIQMWETLKSVIARKIDGQSMLCGEARNISGIARARFNEIEGRLGVLCENIEANNPVAVLKRGFAKPSKDLTTLKKGDEFELLYYNNKTVKGAAQWKG